MIWQLIIDFQIQIKILLTIFFLILNNKLTITHTLIEALILKYRNTWANILIFILLLCVDVKLQTCQEHRQPEPGLKSNDVGLNYWWKPSHIDSETEQSGNQHRNVRSQLSKHYVQLIFQEQVRCRRAENV